jgi:hypothetical protein
MYLDVPFLHDLSSLLKESDLRGKFTLIVAVRPFMAEYDKREELQILKLMKPIMLYYLDEPAGKALITEPLQGEVQYESGVVDYLYRLTSGHPYLLQFMLNDVVNQIRRERRASIVLEDVKAVERKMISGGTAYDAIFEVLISDYSVAEILLPQEALLGKGTLALISKFGEDQAERWVSQSQVFAKLANHGIPETKASGLLSQLVRTKILEEQNSNESLCYRLSVPLLHRRFVEQNLYLRYFHQV